jgi:hypothetical protein
LHLQTWPALRVVGVFQRGEPTAVLARQTRLDSELAKRGKRAKSGARPELVCVNCFTDKGAWPLMLLRIAVEPESSEKVESPTTP